MLKILFSTQWRETIGYCRGGQHVAAADARTEEGGEAMQKIVPHLWFDKEAVEAARFYISILPDSGHLSTKRISGTPSGDCDIVRFRVMGYDFMAISAGPYFTFNPAISFHINCDSDAEVERIWNALLDGGQVLMPLDRYPFSAKFGWLADRFGVNWQIHLSGHPTSHRIVPAFLFTGTLAARAEEAARHYAGIFDQGRVNVLMRHAGGEGPDPAGALQLAELSLAGQSFAVTGSAFEHDFNFNEAVSLIVNCRDQQEIDYYTARLSDVPDAEQCDWVKDRYGVFWQILPWNMDELISRNPERTVPAMLGMKKIIIADLERAGGE